LGLYHKVTKRKRSGEEAFAEFSSTTKHQITTTIATELPEPAPWLPKPQAVDERRLQDEYLRCSGFWLLRSSASALSSSVRKQMAKTQRDKGLRNRANALATVHMRQVGNMLNTNWVASR
jgi:hypothetical protein